jgi:hypothetical protein
LGEEDAIAEGEAGPEAKARSKGRAKPEAARTNEPAAEIRTAKTTSKPSAETAPAKTSATKTTSILRNITIPSCTEAGKGIGYHNAACDRQQRDGELNIRPSREIDCRLEF